MMSQDDRRRDRSRSRERENPYAPQPMMSSFGGMQVSGLQDLNSLQHYNNVFLVSIVPVFGISSHTTIFLPVM
jgi:hypothetical protein